MRSLLGPLVRRGTWARVLHLAIGAWFAVACALVWPGLPDAAPRTLAGLFVAPLPLLALLACVPVVRRSEGLQARALVVPGDDEISVEPAGSWSDRGRLALWLLVRVELGVLAGELAALVVTGIVGLSGNPAAAPWVPRVPAAGAVVAALAAVGLLGYALAGLGALLAAAARRLLHPSLAERLAAQEARTERLLERARLAGELHDSIGHALTVTLLQAGAAREVAGRDPLFVERAFAAIEDSARRAAADLDRVLALLRDSGPAPESPTLADVGGLVRSAEAAGADVDLAVHGSLGDLPAVVSREGYRIVQEALTNALRHAGPVPIRLRIDVRDGGLHLAVRNPVPAAVARQQARARAAACAGCGTVPPSWAARRRPARWATSGGSPSACRWPDRHDDPGAARRRRGARAQRAADDPRGAGRHRGGRRGRGRRRRRPPGGQAPARRRRAGHPDAAGRRHPGDQGPAPAAARAAAGAGGDDVRGGRERLRGALRGGRRVPAQARPPRGDRRRRPGRRPRGEPALPGGDQVARRPARRPAPGTGTSSTT